MFELNTLVNNLNEVYIKSFGCSANQADGEIIAGCLLNAGYKIVDNPNDAKLLIYNTCAVKTPTENRIIDILRKVRREKQLIVTGCLPVINFKRLKNSVNYDALTGPGPGMKIIDIVKRVINGEKVVSFENNLICDLDLPRIPLNPLVSIIPINYGCLGYCSYCCVHNARGKLRSNPIEKIVNRIKRDVNSGIKEFWLTSQDTACFGKDINKNLVDLVNEVCQVKGEFYIRLGMMNPDNVFNILPEIVEAYSHEKVFKFLHLPVQSGDDKVLDMMNRRYSVEQFKEIVCVFRESFPLLTLSTDIICGFPGESKDAFKNTIRLITDIEPDIVNVSKFFSRPKTPAENLTPLPPKELNRRSKELSALSKNISFEKNKAWLNWKGKILLDEKGKEGSLMGRNFAYKPIVIKTCEPLLGKFVEVHIIDVYPTYLEAEIL